MSSLTYSGAALLWAANKLRDENIHLKPACLEAGGKSYYDKVYGATTRQKPLSAEFLEPLFKALPRFKQLLNDFSFFFR